MMQKKSKIALFHHQNPNFVNNFLDTSQDTSQQIRLKNLDDYLYVADIETDSLDTAFGLSNHIDSDWTTNPAVSLKVKTQLRSTSVGDILKKDDIFYRVELTGFSEVQIDERIEIKFNNNTKVFVSNLSEAKESCLCHLAQNILPESLTDTISQECYYATWSVRLVSSQVTEDGKSPDPDLDLKTDCTVVFDTGSRIHYSTLADAGVAIEEAVRQNIFVEEVFTEEDLFCVWDVTIT